MSVHCEDDDDDDEFVDEFPPTLGLLNWIKQFSV